MKTKIVMAFTFVMVLNAAIVTAFVAYCAALMDWPVWLKVMLVIGEIWSAFLTACLAFMMIDIDILNGIQKFLQKYFRNK